MSKDAQFDDLEEVCEGWSRLHNKLRASLVRLRRIEAENKRFARLEAALEDDELGLCALALPFPCPDCGDEPWSCPVCASRACAVTAYRAALRAAVDERETGPCR